MGNNLLETEKIKQIEAKALSLVNTQPEYLEQTELLQKIAEENGITLKQADLKDISGLLYRDEKENWTIMVNQEDSQSRKIFTIAHELGHFFLHSKEHNKFVDSQFIQNCFGRSEVTKYQLAELEANEFAGNLIMPKHIIEKTLGENTKTVKEVDIEHLAKVFKVSPLAMKTRLRNLHYEL